MDEQNVERAIALPINYPDDFPLDGEWRADWLRANHEQQAKLASHFDERLIGFADCAIDGAYAQPPRGIAELQRAIDELVPAGL